MLGFRPTPWNVIYNRRVINFKAQETLSTDISCGSTKLSHQNEISPLQENTLSSKQNIIHTWIGKYSCKVSNHESFVNVKENNTEPMSTWEEFQRYRGKATQAGWGYFQQQGESSFQPLSLRKFQSQSINSSLPLAPSEWGSVAPLQPCVQLRIEF